MGLIQVQSPVLGPSAFRRNVIINGDFRIWQRGGSLTGITAAQFLADRWTSQSATDGVITSLFLLDAPTPAQSGGKLAGSHFSHVTTADASIGAGQFANLGYKVEGYDLLPLVGQVCTLSFWVASAKTGVHCIALRNNVTGPDRSYILEYTVNQANIWEFKALTFTMHDTASGTWNLTNGMGLDIWFMLACGSTYQTTPNQWVTGNYLASSNQVNWMDTIGNGFWLTGVQLERGSVATPFEFRPFAEELALCKRYYEKSYPYLVAPGTPGALNGEVVLYAQSTLGTYYVNASASVAKRASVAATIYSPVTGLSGQARDITATADVAATTQLQGDKHALFSIPATAGNLYVFHWSMAAEL